MDMNVAMLLCAQQMEKYGLKDWKFRWTDSTKTLGMCWHRTKEIGLSRRYVQLNDAESVLDTIRHEIAHAIVGHAAGHGPLWQAIAIGIGATPRACADDIISAAKYDTNCKCGILHPRHGKPRNARECRQCGDRLVYFKK